MITDTTGIVLRQVKAAGGRRMLLIFSKKFGKISVGSSLSEGGKGKSALVTRPFTYGNYELFKSRDSYNLNSGQVIKSYYSIGEDLDKYMAASYVLELTEKLLAEGMPQPKLFNLLLDFMDTLEKRKSKHDTLVMAYIVKVVSLLGTEPVLDECTNCGERFLLEGAEHQYYFCVSEGGLVCPNCIKNFTQEDCKQRLIYTANFDIVGILKYFQKQPMARFEKLALDEAILKRLEVIMRSWLSYHFEINKLKSESFSVSEMAEELANSKKKESPRNESMSGQEFEEGK